jgi:hypothetical protein
MKKKTSRLPYRHHLYPFISLLLMIFGLVVVVEGLLYVTATMITSVVLIYFLSNIAFAIINHQLTVSRTLEIGLLSLLIEYVAIAYLI